MSQIKKLKRIAVVVSGVALLTLISCMPMLAEASRGEKIPPAVDAEQYADFMEKMALGEQDLAEGAELQRDFFNRITPPGVFLLQPMMPSMVPFDDADFTDAFLRGLLGEDMNSVVVYPLSLMLDSKTRETLVYNAEGKLIAILPAEKGVSAWPEGSDPSRVTLLLDLLPAGDVEPYLYTESHIKESLTSVNSRTSKSSEVSRKSLGSSEFGICNIQKLTNGNIRLTVTNGADVAEIFTYTVVHTSSLVVVTNGGVVETNILWTSVSPSFNGIESEWECGTTNLVLTNGVGAWEDTNISSNARLRFYAAAKRGDADEDGLTDGWEILHGLDANDPSDASLDQDDDGWTNLEEYLAGSNLDDPYSHPGDCWYVATNGVDAAGGGDYANPFATLTNAFAHALDGHRVILLPGIYTGIGNRSIFLDNPARSYFMTGLQDHRDATVLDCENNTFFADIISPDVTIRNVAIHNASEKAIMTRTSSGSLFVENCSFISNGMAVDIISNNYLEVTSSLFQGQTARAITSGGQVVVEDSQFVDNGGGIDVGGTGLLSRCVFSNNVSTSDGAAINGSCIIAEDCHFSANQSDGYGGAVYAASNSTFIRCAFVSNTAVQAGGAIKKCAFLTMEHCLLKGNQSFQGGAMVGFYLNPADTSLINCTIVENISSQGWLGSAIDSSMTPLNLVNCIVWDNIPAGLPNNMGNTFSNSCLQEVVATPDSGNIFIDPCFAIDAWGLSYYSPCRDTGMNLAGMDTQTDLNAKPRIMFGTVDMGAYEYGPSQYVDINSTNPIIPYDTWETAATNIQQAIDVSSAHDFIMVNDGIYSTGTVTPNGSIPCRVALTNEIYVHSLNGPTSTVIAGAGSRGPSGVRAIYVGSNSVLKGFSLVSGRTHTNGTSLYQDGGGVWCDIGVKLVNCIISSCMARQGGGVYGGSLENCQVNSNTAESGGGLYESYIVASTLSRNVATVNGGGAYGGTNNSCLISSNTAYAGGGIYMSTAVNCTLKDNAATHGGGAYGGEVETALFIGNYAASNGGGANGSTVYACLIESNSADAGGGVFMSSVENCTLKNNAATQGGGAYGGFIRTSVFKGNSAVSNGGGVYGGTNRSCLIVSNSADTGGGAYMSDMGNSTVCDNTATLAGGTYGGTLLNCIVYYNNSSNWVDGSFANCCSTPMPAGTSNIVSVPQLSYRDIGVYTLEAESPCVDAGASNEWMLSARALNGVSRMQGLAPDMGAYEWEEAADIVPMSIVQVLDRSGSMEGILEQIKAELQTMIDGLFATSLGIVSFSDDAITDWPINSLDNEADKSGPKIVLAQLPVWWAGTCVDCGLYAASANLDILEDATEKSIVLWTDDNGYSLQDVPAEYHISGVASLSSWNADYLSWVAQRRRGRFLANPTSCGLVGMTSLPLLMCQETNVLATTTNIHSISIDGTLHTTIFRFTQNTTNAPEIEFEIYQPSGNAITTNDANVSYAEYAGGKVLTVSSPLIGIWTVKVSCVSISNEYLLAVQGIGGAKTRFVMENIRYPENTLIPIQIMTDSIATNVTVFATNAFGEGATNIVLFDDGLHDDGAARDGLFCAQAGSFSSGQSWRLKATAQGRWPDGSEFNRLAEQSIYISSGSQLVAPSNCVASLNQTNQIQVSWSAITNTWYEIQRSSYSNTWHDAKLVGSLASASVTDTNIVAGTIYYYRIRAFETGHFDSEFSPVLTGSAVAY